jgi:hypothetical protein
MFYGLVQDGYHPLIAQPFGVPSPSLKPAGALYSFSGTGLYPNSKLTANSKFTLDTVDPRPPVAGVFEELSATSSPDGSFSAIVVPENSSVLDEAGTTVGVTVIDAYGNWAECGARLPHGPKVRPLRAGRPRSSTNLWCQDRYAQPQTVTITDRRHPRICC